MHDEVGAKATDGGEGTFSSFPDKEAVGLVDRHAGGEGLSFGKNGVELPFFGGDFFMGAFEFDDEDGFSAFGVSTGDGSLGSFDGEGVHDFESTREESGIDDSRDGIAGGFEGVVSDEDGVEGFGGGEESEGDLESDAEKAFGTAEEAGVIGAEMLAAAATEFDDFAGGKNNFHAEDMVGGHAVFEAMRAAGVEGNVSSNGADGLAGGVGSVVETVGRGGFGDVEIDDAGFDDGDAVLRIKVDDSVESIQGDDDAIFDGEGAT